jgi:hypothetical protein
MKLSHENPRLGIRTALVASHAAAKAPGPALEVGYRTTDTTKTATFERGARLSTDRPYTRSEPPTALKDQSFLRTNIDGVRVRRSAQTPPCPSNRLSVSC